MTRPTRSQAAVLGTLMAIGAAPLTVAAEAPGAPGTILPLALSLQVSVEPGLARIPVEARVTFRAEVPLTEATFLLGPQLEIEVVEDAAGNRLSHRRPPGAIVVGTGPLPAGAVTTWVFRYRWRLPRPLEELGGLHASGPWYPYVRRPASGREFPRYLPTRARISVSLPEPWVAVSAGRMAVRRDGGRRRYVWTQARPSPLHPLVIGEYEMAEERFGSLTCRAFFRPSHRDRARRLLGYAGAVLRYYTEALGTFPAEAYSVAEAPLPQGVRGLTLPGLTILPAADADTGAPFPYRILAHEIAHQWWNYGVEFARRSDGWLREGLPTYSAMLFLESEYGSGRLRQELAHSRSLALSPDRPEPLAMGFDMRSAEALYPLNYHKAALVLHMLRGLMGRQRFVAFLRGFYAAFAGGSATAEDFQRHAEAAYGGGLDWFFAAWVERAAVPRFLVRYVVRRTPGAQPPAYDLEGTIVQEAAGVQGPVRVRILLQGAPPMERTVWVGPGSTRFRLTCPTPVVALEFDPHQELLHAGATVQRVAALESGTGPEQAAQPVPQGGQGAPQPGPH